MPDGFTIDSERVATAHLEQSGVMTFGFPGMAAQQSYPIEALMPLTELVGYRGTNTCEGRSKTTTYVPGGQPSYQYFVRSVDNVEINGTYENRALNLGLTRTLVFESGQQTTEPRGASLSVERHVPGMITFTNGLRLQRDGTTWLSLGPAPDAPDPLASWCRLAGAQWDTLTSETGYVFTR